MFFRNRSELNEAREIYSAQLDRQVKKFKDKTLGTDKSSIRTDASAEKTESDEEEEEEVVEAIEE